jgi:hypothetical protein
MKKIFSFLFLVILFSTVSFSQEKDTESRRAEFNGTWVLEKSTSRYGSDKKVFDQYLMYITFKDNEFNVTKVFVVDKKAANYGIKLLTDKSGEKNNYTGYEGNIARTSKTHWEKATLVSEYKLTPDTKQYTLGGTERYSLSKDGQKLIFESVQTYPVVPLNLEDLVKVRMVFRRKDSK